MRVPSIIFILLFIMGCQKRPAELSISIPNDFVGVIRVNYDVPTDQVAYNGDESFILVPRSGELYARKPLFEKWRLIKWAYEDGRGFALNGPDPIVGELFGSTPTFDILVVGPVSAIEKTKTDRSAIVFGLPGVRPDWLPAVATRPSIHMDTNDR